jgi:HEAT repeat protein
MNAMESNSRLWAFAACLVSGLVVSLGVYGAFRYYRHHAGRRAGAGVSATQAASASARHGSHGAGPAVGNLAGDQEQLQRAQIRLLQSLLDQKTALLKKKIALLEQKEAEHRTLRSELDAAIELLDTLSGEVPADPATPPHKPNERLHGELEALRVEADKNKASASSQQAELTWLQAELTATDAKIAEWQQEATAELNALRQHREALEVVITATLVRIGEPAVPVLLEHLGDSRGAVRRWAATMLGAMGAPAKAATPSLIESLGDQDPEVRVAVKQALERIEGAPR